MSVTLEQATASNAESGIKQIYAEQLTLNVNGLRDRFGDETVGVSVPTFDSIKATMHRSGAKLRPVLPQTLQDLRLEHPWTKTLDGKDFLLIDDGTTERILGFSTVELHTALSDAEVVFVDGTFKIAPLIFTQLYTLHAFFRGQMIPCAFFLLPDKT